MPFLFFGFRDLRPRAPQAQRLRRRTEFVREADDVAFPIPRRERGQRPHVPKDDVLLPAVQAERLFRVFERGSGVREPVQPFPAAFLMPVVQEKIVQQRAADQAPAVHGEIQPLAEPITQVRDPKTVVQAGNVGVLDEGSHQTDLVRPQQFRNASIKKSFFALRQSQDLHLR